jgi:hypothetical protein
LEVLNSKVRIVEKREKERLLLLQKSSWQVSEEGTPPLLRLSEFQKLIAQARFGRQR